MEKLPTPSINLARNRGQHLSDRVLAFALTIGRVLVIITEAIALGAFLFRFGLDRQLVDLHDRITQEQAVVNLLKKNETTYRNFQDRLTLESNLVNNTNTSLTLYQDISSMIPSDMTVTGIYFSNATIQIGGDIPSLISLSDLVKKLQGYSQTSRVSLDKIQDKAAEGTISVAITVYLKNPSPKTLL